MTKDEALKMAIDFMETLTIDIGIKTWNEKHRKEAINACKEAMSYLTYIAQQTPSIINTCKEALEQPVKSITEGATMFKQIGNSPKPPPPPPPMHTCIYSRTMNQEYPRKCIQCGKVEAIGPAQEPVKNVTLSCGCKSHYLGFPSEWDGETKECQPCTNYGVLCEKHFEEWEARPVQYTNPHQVVPTSTWQGLTDDEIRKVYFELYDSGLPTMCFAHAIEQALKEKNT